MPVKRQNKNFKKDAESEIRKQVEYLMKIYTFQILLRLLAHGRFQGATPVGNPDLWISKPPKGYSGGKARHNWRIGIDNKPNDNEEEGTDNPIGSLQIEVGKIKETTQKVWISNPLPYIDRILNQGHSSQVPINSLPITIMETVDYVKRNYKGKIPANAIP